MKIENKQIMVDVVFILIAISIISILMFFVGKYLIEHDIVNLGYTSILCLVFAVLAFGNILLFLVLNDKIHDIVGNEIKQ